MITFLSAASLVLLCLCTASILVFVLRYLGTKWQTFEEGRHMMAFSVVIFMILGTTLSAALFDGRGHQVAWLWIQVVEFTLLLVVLLWRLSLLFRAQSRMGQRWWPALFSRARQPLADPPHPLRRSTDV